MSWAFSPLLPGAAHQQSDPNAVSISEAATAASAQDATVTSTYPVAITEQAGTLSDAGIAYTAGGSPSAITPINVIEKTLLATETAGSVSATLNTARAYFSGLSSSTKGYCGGGQNTSSVQVAEIDGIVFSSEAANNPTAALNTARDNLAGVESSAKGYWIAGTDTGSLLTTEIDGVLFSNDSAVNPTAALSVETSASSGVNSSTVGYALGGENDYTEIHGVQFSDDSFYNPSATLDGDLMRGGGGQSASNGYVAGGTWTMSAVKKLVFSTEVASTLGATLSTGRRDFSGSENSTHVFFIGGYSGSARLSSIEKLSFSGEAVSAVSASLSAIKSAAACMTYVNSSSAASAAHDAEITSGTPAAIVETGSPTDAPTVSGLATSAAITQVATGADSSNATTQNEQTTTQAATATDSPAATYLASAAAAEAASAGHSTTMQTNAAISESAYGAGGKGYFAGGVVYGGGNISDINRLTFSTHVAAVLSATLATARKNAGACASSANGYWVGGFTTTYSAQIDGIRFYDESARNPSMSISTTTDLAGTESLVKGYIAGGMDGLPVSFIRTVAFFPESTSELASSLPVGKFDMAAMASPSGAYFAGGKNGSTYYDAIHGMPFSTETVSTLSAVLGATKSRHAGMASSLCGYFTGGSNAGSPTTAIDRLGFSSEARTTLGATLSVARVQHAGCTSLERGYSAGGYDGGTFYSYAIESLIFSSETVSTTSAVLGNGSDGTVDLAGTQNRGGAVDYATGEWAPSEQAESASAADAKDAALSTPADITESASATSSQSVLAAFASSVTEAASATSAHPVLMTAVSAISEVAPAVDVVAALAVFVVASSAAASGTDAPAATAALVAAEQEAATASDSSDGTPVSGTNSVAEGVSADASASVQAAFVSAIGEAAAATSVNTGGFAVARGEAASAADVPAAGAAYPLSQAETASLADSSVAGLSIPVSEAESTSSVDAQVAVQAFPVDRTESGSAADSHNASYGAQNAEATGSATATDSTDSTPGVWIDEQASPSTSDAVVQARYTGFSAAAAAIADAFCTGPVSASRIEAASAVDVPVGRPSWPVSGEDAASATASQVSEFAFFVTESGAAASDAAGVAEKDAAGVAQASAVDLPAVVRMAFAEGYSIAYPVEVHDATVYFTLVSQAVEAASGAAAAGAVVTTSAHGSESATPGAEQQAIKLAAAGAIEAAFATDEALGGRVFSGYVLALAGAADYSDAFILDLLPPSLGTAVKVIRQGNTAYVIMAVDQRSISADRGDRAIRYRAESARMVDVVSHERHVDETQQVRDILLPDDPRDLLSDE